MLLLNTENLQSTTHNASESGSSVNNFSASKCVDKHLGFWHRRRWRSKDILQIPPEITVYNFVNDAFLWSTMLSCRINFPKKIHQLSIELHCGLFCWAHNAISYWSLCKWLINLVELQGKLKLRPVEVGHCLCLDNSVLSSITLRRIWWTKLNYIAPPDHLKRTEVLSSRHSLKVQLARRGGTSEAARRQR